LGRFENTFFCAMASRLVITVKECVAIECFLFLRKEFLTKARVLAKDVLISCRFNKESKSSRNIVLIHDHALIISYEK